MAYCAVAELAIRTQQFEKEMGRGRERERENESEKQAKTNKRTSNRPVAHKKYNKE